MKKLFNNLGLVVLASLVLYVLGLTVGDLAASEPEYALRTDDTEHISTHRDRKAVTEHDFEHFNKHWEKEFDRFLEDCSGEYSREFKFETREDLEVYIGRKQGRDIHKHHCTEDTHKHDEHHDLEVKSDGHKGHKHDKGAKTHEHRCEDATHKHDEHHDVEYDIDEPVYRILPIEPEIEHEEHHENE